MLQGNLKRVRVTALLVGAEQSPTLRGTRYYGEHLAGVQLLSKVCYRYLGASITCSYVLSEHFRGAPKYTGALLYRSPMYYQSTSRVLLSTQKHVIKS
jgi:hypothetical protein